MTFHIKNLQVSVGDRELLTNAEFTIEEGGLCLLVGRSGGGKSTLLRILCGLEPPNSSHGQIRWSGSIVWKSASSPAGPSGSSSDPPRLGLVFQTPALLDDWSPKDNVQIAIDHRGSKNSLSSDLSSSTRSFEDSALGWLEHLDVPLDVPISRMSGGQRQRLSLAQALASQPDILVYDEPTTGLDRLNAERVAQLIKSIQEEDGVTSIVVTHDYASFEPHANGWLFLDSSEKTMIACRKEEIASRIDSDRGSTGSALGTTNSKPSREKHHPGRAYATRRWGTKLVFLLLGSFESVGKIVEWAIRGLLSVIPRFQRWYWGRRFLATYCQLVFGVTAILYLTVAGCILGFVTTFFTLRYMPYKVYTEPLLLEELLGVIGFALYRILIPVLSTILIAARCAAAVSADLGNKRYGGQIESLTLLRIRPERYLFTSVTWSFLLGSLLLNQIAFAAAKGASLLVHLAMQPELGANYWDLYFHAPLRTPSHSWYLGSSWVILKLLLSALGTSTLTYALATRPKWSSGDVSKTITNTILWSTLWVLLVHWLVAFFEFTP